MCLNDQHLGTIFTKMALAVLYGADPFELSTIKIESRTDGVNGTSVLPGFGAKSLSSQ